MKKCPLTMANGATVGEDQNSITAGARGSVTFDNFHLFEKLAHFNRERIPERVVHARGTGAYGTFTLTKDLSQYSQANFLRHVGQKTKLFVRFSTVGGGQDSNDYARDPRGFAIKFYTDQGNLDIVGNNTPVFFLRDAIKFPDFVHSQKKDPRTNVPNPARMYEFWANSPQSFHQMTILMSDRGIPASYRHMHGFSSHTLSLYNDKQQRYWVKWHFKTNQGIKTLTNEEAAKLPSFGAQKDLVDAIDRKEFPSWAVKLQIMTVDEAKNYHINPFDLTKVWPYKDFPLIDIGVIELNKNVENYFMEVEQSAFSPSNVIAGVGVSPDKMLQARLLAYPDAHRYRIGTNFSQLDVNRPICPVNNYQRDGAMAINHLNNKEQINNVNFYPNEQSGYPSPDSSCQEPPLPILGDAWIKAYDSQDEDNFSQAGNLFRLMTQGQKQQLVNNIASGLAQASVTIQDKMLKQFYAADQEYGDMIKKLL
ncbi:MAG: catalase [Burkholderiales bacterium]|jgi:catalase|nr:catalase [Burkholderiales bacterium]